ncbi:aminotransferase class V-fold PLP-dependent enzyme [Chloroflexota bacterium]
MYLPVDRYCILDLSEVKKVITSKTIPISVMHANNETATVQPIDVIGKITRKAGISFHTDAVQTAGHVPVVRMEEGGINETATKQVKKPGS